MSKVFLDTNILVYCLDDHSKKKKRICRDLLRAVSIENCGVISTQVLQEFFVVATKKLGVDPLDAKNLVTAYQNLEVVVITPLIIQNAIDCSVVNRISFWDALIIVAAESAACAELVTEDLNTGQIIRGVRISNPLESGLS